MLTTRTVYLDVLLTAIAPLLWGSTYIITSEILPPDRPLTAALLRCLPAGVLLLLYSRRWPATGQWWRLGVLALLNIALFQSLLFVAAYRLPGGLAAVLGALQPLWVLALAWWVNQQRPQRWAVLGGIGGVVGMAALLLSPSSHWETWGVLAALGGALCMASGTFLARRWTSDLPVLALTGWQLLLGGLMLWPFAYWFDPALPTLTAHQVAGYAYLALAGALLAYALWFRGVARLPTVAVSALGLLSPVSAVLLGWLILGQALRGTALLGMLLVLLSVLMVQLSAQSAPKRARG